jgi:cold shock CspA family protein
MADNSTTRYLGQVKFFGRKGYGFLTAVEGPFKDQDVFVHHSAIEPVYSTYRILRKGEFVEFAIVDSTTEPDKKHAAHVTGVRGYPLMCDISYQLHQQTDENQPAR